MLEFVRAAQAGPRDHPRAVSRAPVTALSQRKGAGRKKIHQSHGLVEQAPSAHFCSSLLAMNPYSSTDSTPDTLMELELRVARRADELTRTSSMEAPLSLECWLRAEAEIFSGVADGPFPVEATD